MHALNVLYKALGEEGAAKLLQHAKDIKAEGAEFL